MSESRRGSEAAAGSAGSLRFGAANYAALAAGVVAIIAGYVLLNGGSVTAAPVLLILGYAVCLPAGLFDVLAQSEFQRWRRLGESDVE